eukprot:m.38332 g.38332  ORF g.38332 m.38332 type:complete len:68 (+) comp6791_c0_seq1:2960-3163(+)
MRTFSKDTYPIASTNSFLWYQKKNNRGEENTHKKGMKHDGSEAVWQHHNCREDPNLINIAVASKPTV